MNPPITSADDRRRPWSTTGCSTFEPKSGSRARRSMSTSACCATLLSPRSASIGLSELTTERINAVLAELGTAEPEPSAQGQGRDGRDARHCRRARRAHRQSGPRVAEHQPTRA